MHARLSAALLSAAALLPAPLGAQQRPPAPNAPARAPAAAGPVAPVAGRVGERPSEMADVVLQYSLDRAALQRRYDAESSPDRRRRMRAFYTGWRDRLREVKFDKLGQEGRVDYVLLDATLRAELAELAQADTIAAQVASLAPFAPALAAMHEARRRLDQPDPAASARLLTQVARQVDSLRKQIEQQRPAAAAATSSPAAPPRRADSAAVAAPDADAAAIRKQAIASGVAHGGLESV